MFFAGPENGGKIIMESPWRLKLHFGQIGAASGSGSLSAIESYWMAEKWQGDNPGG